MSNKIGPIWLVIFCGLVFPAAAQRLYPVYPVQGVLTLDGKLQEAAWQGAPLAGDFFPVGATAPGQATQFRMLFDSNMLYIAVVASERSMSRLQVTKNDGEAVWADDAVEIFLSDGANRAYQRFAVNAAGKRSDIRISAGADRSNDAWTLEIGIPFAFFLVPPKPGAVIRGNVCRNRRCGAPEASAWSRVDKSFHEQANFAQFWIRPVSAAPARITNINQYVNLAYVQDLVENAQDIMRQCARLEQGLQKYGMPDKTSETVKQELVTSWSTRRARAGAYVAYIEYFQPWRRAPDFWELNCDHLLGRVQCPAASEFLAPFEPDARERQLRDYFQLKRLFDE